MIYSQKRMTIFCVLGESASGKDSLVRDLCNLHPTIFKPVVSYTNRPKRDNETNGKEHWFLSPEKFKYKYDEDLYDGKVLAYTKISKDGKGYEYYASSDEITKNNSNVYIINPEGFYFLKENFSDQFNLIPIYINATKEERRERARVGRSDFDKEYENRVKAEEEQFQEFKEGINTSYFEIENHDDGYDYALSSLDIFCIGCYNALMKRL